LKKDTESASELDEAMELITENGKCFLNQKL